MTPALALIGAVLTAWQAGADGARSEAGSPLGLADLPEYRAALQPDRPGEAAAPPQAVTFQDLWDHPERFQGQRIQVAGRVVREFHQGAVGTYPALAEVWVATPAGDLLCLVFPEAGGSPAPPVGSQVRFVGTFLRRIQYHGGDAPRLAPLIVGSQAPATTGPGESERPADPVARAATTWVDVAVGLSMGVVVLAVLARLHLSRPAHLRLGDDREGPPQFVDGDKPEGPPHEL